MSKKKEKDHGYDDGSYVIKKSLKFSFFAFILCMLIAFAIWVYAANKELRSMEEDEETGNDSLYSQTCPDVPSDRML